MLGTETYMVQARRDQLERSRWYAGGFLLTFLATSEETRGRFMLVEEVGGKGISSNPPLHLHTREEESFYVIEGEMTFYLGDTTIHAGPGAFITLPRGIPHTWVVESETLRLLNMCVPGGFDGFLRELSVPVDALTPPPPADGPPDVERLVATAARYGVEIVGPPPA